MIALRTKVYVTLFAPDSQRLEMTSEQKNILTYMHTLPDRASDLD